MIYRNHDILVSNLITSICNKTLQNKVRPSMMSGNVTSQDELRSQLVIEIDIFEAVYKMMIEFPCHMATCSLLNAQCNDKYDGPNPPIQHAKKVFVENTET